MDTYQHSHHRDNPIGLAVGDVICVPREGKLDSRGHAQIHPFIYSAPMDTVTGFELATKLSSLGEYAVVSRFIPGDEYVETIKSLGNRPNVFFAIGMNFKARLSVFQSLWPNRPMNLALDVAHGDMKQAHRVIQQITEKYPVEKMMSGSICTPEAALRAVNAGCTHLRVGVGGGSVCTTRIMTGCGIPNFTAVNLIHHTLAVNHMRQGITIIADGGISHPGDAVKYLAGGADGVMIGRLLSQTEESAGWQQVKFNGGVKLVKSYRGQASKAFQSDYDRNSMTPEGVSLPLMEWDGLTVQDVVRHFRGGLAAGCSMLGVESSEELSPELIQFMVVSPGGRQEALPIGGKFDL